MSLDLRLKRRPSVERAKNSLGWILGTMLSVPLISLVLLLPLAILARFVYFVLGI